MVKLLERVGSATESPILDILRLYSIYTIKRKLYTLLDVIAPNEKSQRPHKPPMDICVTWDLNRRLEDLDRDGIDRQVLIFHTSHVFYGAEPRVAVQAARDIPVLRAKLENMMEAARTF